MKRLGVVGSMVWDTIYGRDPAQPAVEEWGGISYSLAALDATLGDDWEIVPLVKVGRDVAERANVFLRSLHHVAPGARFVEVPDANNRVTLRYYSSERRCEQMTGGVPPWTWPELGPQLADLDALYLNFISGYEMTVETAQFLRRGFRHLSTPTCIASSSAKNRTGRASCSRSPTRQPGSAASTWCSSTKRR